MNHLSLFLRAYPRTGNRGGQAHFASRTTQNEPVPAVSAIGFGPFTAGLAQYKPNRFDLSSSPDPANYTGFAVVVAMLIGLALGLYAVRRYLAWRDRPAPRSMTKLFRELSRAHGLDRGERRQLKRLASERGVYPSARLFLEPVHFEGQPLAALREKLFGA